MWCPEFSGSEAWVISGYDEMGQMVGIWGDEYFPGRGNNVNTRHQVATGRILKRRQSIRWRRKLWDHAGKDVRLNQGFQSGFGGT